MNDEDRKALEDCYFDDFGHEFDEDRCGGFLDMYAAGLERGRWKWKKVSEARPDLGRVVLLACANGKIRVGRFIEGGGNVWCIFMRGSSDPTHWRELPEPPRGE